MITYGMKDSEENMEEQRLFQRVFNTDDGGKVLAIILADLQHFEGYNHSDPAANALRSYAISLLERLGIYHEDNLERIVRSILKVKPYSPPLMRDNKED